MAGFLYRLKLIFVSPGCYWTLLDLVNLHNVHSILLLGTGKSHQNTSAGKIDPEGAVWNCWLLALFNDVIVYDVTTHTTTLQPLSMALNVTNLNNFYAPAIKWLGHIVLPLSVIRSFRHSVLPDSVSAHYLSHTWRFSNEIWYIGLSGEYAGWVRSWVGSNNFRQSYAPWT